jgi:serine protease AprX
VECEVLRRWSVMRRQEVQSEEDNFVAALEWGVARGALVASSSVGFWKWRRFAELDGRAAPASRAVAAASRRGLVVVQAAGNLRPAGGLVSPADSPAAIAVGAASLAARPSFFSSHGPTPDGRIKACPALSLSCSTSPSDNASDCSPMSVLLAKMYMLPTIVADTRN